MMMMMMMLVRNFRDAGWGAYRFFREQRCHLELRGRRGEGEAGMMLTYKLLSFGSLQ